MNYKTAVKVRAGDVTGPMRPAPADLKSSSRLHRTLIGTVLDGMQHDSEDAGETRVMPANLNATFVPGFESSMRKNCKADAPEPINVRCSAMHSGDVLIDKSRALSPYLNSGLPGKPGSLTSGHCTEIAVTPPTGKRGGRGFDPRQLHQNHLDGGIGRRRQEAATQMNAQWRAGSSPARDGFGGLIWIRRRA